MKKIAIVLLTSLFIVSCSSDDDKNTSESPDLLGNWRLIEIYSDPGDGSGDFVAIESDKMISFEANDILESNANLCHPFSDSGEPSSGTYSQEDSTIYISSCGIVVFSPSFEMINDNLIVSYPCIEACQEKYIKVN